MAWKIFKLETSEYKLNCWCWKLYSDNRYIHLWCKFLLIFLMKKLYILLVDGGFSFFLWPSGLICSCLVRSFEAKDKSNISYLNSCSGTSNELCAAASKIWEYLSFKKHSFCFYFSDVCVIGCCLCFEKFLSCRGWLDLCLSLKFLL